jgi:prepilin-type N-terminal cleavage/methylation domain-containing protein
MLKDLKFRARRGFSLLELMIVVVLIAGILAITWPSIARPMRKAELSEATQKLREAIEDGRYQAMVSGEPVFLQITQGDSQMRSGGIDALIQGKLEEQSVDQDLDSKVSGRGEYEAAGASNRNLQESLGAASDSSHSAHPVMSRVWKLPENIVVSSVHWMDDQSDSEGSLGMDASDSASESSAYESSGSAGGNSGSMTGGVAGGSSGGYPSSDDSASDFGSSEKWCLPMSAQGLGRDAEITLLDKRARKTLTVSFTAATGELEIVR